MPVFTKVKTRSSTVLIDLTKDGTPAPSVVLAKQRDITLPETLPETGDGGGLADGTVVVYTCLPTLKAKQHTGFSARPVISARQCFPRHSQKRCPDLGARRLVAFVPCRHQVVMPDA